MKTKEEVLALFRDKYAYLKSVYPEVGPFDESKLHQKPDGGWQIDLENWAAITIRPDADEPHETHGAICERWYQEGGAFDDNGTPGWLGYPINDERKCVFYVDTPCPCFWRGTESPSSTTVQGAVSEFEYGTIQWHEGVSSERVFNEHPELRGWGVIRGPIAINQTTWIELSEIARKHVHQDIESAILRIICSRHFHPEKSEVDCSLSREANCLGPEWTFRMVDHDKASLNVRIWHDAAHNILGQLEASPKTFSERIRTFFAGETVLQEAIFIPSSFKASP